MPNRMGTKNYLCVLPKSSTKLAEFTCGGCQKEVQAEVEGYLKGRIVICPECGQWHGWDEFGVWPKPKHPHYVAQHNHHEAWRLEIRLRKLCIADSSNERLARIHNKALQRLNRRQETYEKEDKKLNKALGLTG